jgi:cytochrome P450
MSLSGLDERVTEDPFTVDFTRKLPQHSAFGTGVHACPGRVLAQREIKIFLEEWMARLPAFAIKPGTLPHFSTSLINSVEELQLSW